MTCPPPPTASDAAVSAELGSRCPPLAEWSRRSELLAAAGFTHAFCHHGRPGDRETCGVLAPGRRLQKARQVHGSAVASAWGWSEEDAPDADAVIAGDPALACAVRTADCGPVLVGCRATGAAAAIHAGWRGIAGGVIPSAVRALAQSFGAQPEAMVAAVGPCARGARYEVGEEVADAIALAGCADAIVRRPHAPRPFLDVAHAAALQLAAAGVPIGSIDADPPCSIESEWCPSHRRDPACGARMLSIIVPLPSPAHG